ncbi:MULTISPECIES: DUF6458 family protein [Thermomonospora]|uniref:DUF6458 domain-containing protein n=1 Tax=Thermomonospora curvata (strain ATCC 19995 / DSM 43183 / JCM 3096 / KCTC 9072 / NBRC 15933 / NCIMB 10081 / Henssen B9) TaxID=471852 RepID=D1ABS3_THECD|nr:MULTISPECIES: DUF6458 family protein [Thermomonospora]ACY99096.1 hypothetical protein Tcur_3561 [Thermomonospora curvata DSM 43183]PKK13278.1 MAG: hypothetical protein BUE48_017455 [Thermomonospora sp. CIF 1]
MTIGGGLALIIIGAILTYAVDYRISGVDITVVGVILMIGGLAWLVLGLIRFAIARKGGAAPPPEAPAREERRYRDPY